MLHSSPTRSRPWRRRLVAVRRLGAAGGVRTALACLPFLFGCGDGGTGPSFPAPTSPRIAPPPEVGASAAPAPPPPEPAEAGSAARSTLAPQLALATAPGPAPASFSAAAESGMVETMEVATREPPQEPEVTSSEEEEEEEEEEGEEEEQQQPQHQVPCDSFQPSISAVLLANRDVRVSWSYPNEPECYWDGLFDVVGGNLNLGQTTKTTATDTGLTGGKDACYVVTADGKTAKACVTIPKRCDIKTATIEVPDNSVTLPSGVDLSWTHTDNGECDNVLYTVYQDTKAISSLTGTSKKRATLTLAPREHDFKVKAYEGSEEETSDEKTVTVKCPTPTKRTLSSSVSGNTISLSWNAVASVPSGCSVSYNIYRGGALLKNVSGTSHDDTGLSPGAYSYEVTAESKPEGGKSAKSNRVSETVEEPPPAAPPTPDGVGATAQSTSSVRITWNSAERASGYTVKKTSPGADETRTTEGTGYTWTPLGAGTEYCFEVQATNAGGSSGWSEEVCATTLTRVVRPAIPANVSAAAQSASSIRIAWDPVSGAARYEVRIEDDDTTRLSVTETSRDWSSLSPGTEYCFEVRAVNAAGSSGWSSAACATTSVNPPPTPGGVAAAAQSATTIRISWNAAARATGYEVKKASPDPEETETAEGTEYDWDELTGSTEYCFEVRATNAGGTSSWSSEVCATTAAPTPAPDAPQNLAATASSSSVISVSWDAVTGADSYELLRRPGSGSYPADSNAVSVTSGESYRDTGRTASTKYCYQVRTVDGGDRSAWSSEACATTPAAPPPPPAPQNFRAVAASSSSVELSWSAVSGADSYEVRIKALRPAALGDWTDVGSGTSHTVSDLQPEGSYDFQLRAVRSGLRSEAVQATARTPAFRPDAPGDFAAESASATSVRLSWSAVAGADGYELRRKVGNGAYGEAFSAGSGTSHEDTGRRTGRKHCYQARTVDGGRRSEWTSEACATPREAKPAAPANVTATADSSVSVTVRWDAVTGADGYRVRWKKGRGGWSAAADAGTGTSYAHRGLHPGTRYQVQVRAVRGRRESGWSAAAKVTTPALEVPTGLAADAVSSSAVRATWDAAPAAESYELERRRMSDTARTEIPVTGTSHDDDGRLAETTYEYRVRSVVTRDGAKVTSAWSGKVTVTTPREALGVPANVSASAASPVSVELSWDAVSGADGYRVRWKQGRGGWSAALDAGTGTSWTHAGRAPETEYRYQVRAALGRRRSAWSATAKATTPALGVPAGLVAEAASSSAVRVRWDAVSAADGYEIERRRMSDAAYTVIPVTGTSHEDDELSAETTYEYRVRSVLGGGSAKVVSAWSAKVTVTTPAVALGVPANVTARAGSSVSVSVGWDRVSGAESYEIRKKKGRGRWGSAADAGTGTSYESGGLAPETTYRYEVRAVSGTRRSEWSAAARVTTPALEVPANLQAAPDSSSRVQVTWDAVSAADSYEVERRKKSESAYTVIPVSGTRHDDSELAAATTYEYRVRSVRERGGAKWLSAWSARVSATTPAATPGG